MPRPSKQHSALRAGDFAPAHTIKTRFGLSTWTLQKLAMAGVIRHETIPAEFHAYSVEDVQRYLASLAPRDTAK